MAFARPHAGGNRHMSTPPPTRWRHFAHGADIGVHGEGDSPAAAFAQAALALAAITTPPDGVKPQREVEVRCAAPDLELLLVDWLNALITAAATETPGVRPVRCRDSGRTRRRAGGSPAAPAASRSTGTVINSASRRRARR
jgi:SHS2 domain-containing protein